MPATQSQAGVQSHSLEETQHAPFPPLASGTSYHVTLRCNNQAFDLRRPQARKALLFCLARAGERFGFRLHGLCIMSNHVHYLIRPAIPADMPRLMHWLNWYSAMLLNRLLRRRGHFWERRYHAVAVPDRDTRHALYVLRYIHGNPRAARMAEDFDWPYGNYAAYARALDDGFSVWHPAYLRLGPTLDICARRYRQFCRRYRPQAKPQAWPRWGAWRLWLAIEPGRAPDQGSLFGNGARYRGGRKRAGHAPRLAVMRPVVLAAVERFVRVNQASAAGWRE
jgi:putative transposase